jgi:prepilin-type N-terminal cleavage/methylation domain-containing protein
LSRRSQTKADQPSTLNYYPAFTLIELLIVIAIIAILAALTIPITGAVTRARIKSVATGELSNIETAIESYKAKTGTYPPDCVAPGSIPGNPIYINQLYYELLGTTLDNAGIYTTKDGSSQINSTAVPLTFGPGVGGFVNATKGAGGDEGTVATAFLRGLKPSQIGSNIAGVKILVCSVPWPKDNAWQPSGIAGSGQNPWRYISSNPTNNPNSFDLWVDVIINGKTNRINNWGQPKIVGTP